MKSKDISALATRQRRVQAHTVLLAFLLLPSAPATAAETITMNVESQALDLDAGSLVDVLTANLNGPNGADVQLAYNADRTPHTIVVPVAEGVEVAFVASVGFDGVTSSDVPSLAFSTEPTDLPFSPSDCVVIRTDQGAVFKLGNATEAGLSVTFNYEQL